MFNAIKRAFAAPITVKQIHNEFDSAVEILISKALEINPIDEEKHITLKELGFAKSSHVKKMSYIIESREKNAKIAERVNYFSQHYPFNKFITAELAENICKKYGLVLGDASNFIGHIPDKNIKEISSFNLRQEDMVKHVNYWYVTEYRGMGYDIKRVEKGTPGAIFGYPRWSQNFYVSGESENEVDYIKEPFKMVAPVKDFDMTGKRLSGVYIQDIPDPIVLQPVDGGYLIVSKWGDEASDKDLVNETMN